MSSGGIMLTGPAIGIFAAVCKCFKVFFFNWWYDSDTMTEVLGNKNLHQGNPIAGLGRQSEKSLPFDSKTYFTKASKR